MAKTATTPAVAAAAEPDLNELLASKAEIDAKIAAIQKANRAANIAKAREFCTKHGLTAADVFPGTASASKPTGKRQIAKPAPKYRDASGNTWTGRGFKPVWLRNAIAAGAKLDDFLIEAL